MIDAARGLAAGSDAAGLAAKVHGMPTDAAGSGAFLQEVDGLRQELAAMASPQPGRAVAAAHAAIRAAIPFLDRDRALGGEVATALQLVADGSVLAAARHALSR